MVSLVGPTAPSGPRRAFLEELQTGSSLDEPVDFFHVAVDLPGYGFSKSFRHDGKKQRSSSSKSVTGGSSAAGPLAPADLLADIIKSLGKHYAFMVIASNDSAAAIFSALCEQPNLTSFLVVREPQVHDMESLYAVFQPTLIAAEARGKRSLDSGAMSQALLHSTVHEWSRKRTPRYLDKEIAHDILAMLRARKWRGQLGGFGHSKRRPLLTRLVGGMKMWRGEKDFRELRAPPVGKAAAVTTEEPHASGAAKVGFGGEIVVEVGEAAGGASSPVVPRSPKQQPSSPSSPTVAMAGLSIS